DSAQRLIALSDGQSRPLNFGYNNQGLLTTVSNAYSRLVSIVYDVADRPYIVTDANNVSHTNSFDLLDHILTRLWPGGGVEGFLWATNGLLAYTNQDGHVTWTARDTAGQIIGVTNANNEIIAAARNALGKVSDLWDGR